MTTFIADYIFGTRRRQSRSRTLVGSSILKVLGAGDLGAAGTRRPAETAGNRRSEAKPDFTEKGMPVIIAGDPAPDLDRS